MYQEHTYKKDEIFDLNLFYPQESIILESDLYASEGTKIAKISLANLKVILD